MVFRNLIRQLETPDHLRGRMVGVNMVFFIGGPQLGELEAGLVAQWLGPVVSVVSGGLACIVATGWIAATTPALRRYRRRAKSDCLDAADARSSDLRQIIMRARGHAERHRPVRSLGRRGGGLRRAEKSPLTRTLDKKEVEDEVAEALGKLGHEATLHCLDGSDQEPARARAHGVRSRLQSRRVVRRQRHAPTRASPRTSS